MQNTEADKYMNKAWQHFKTITHHKYLVMKGCFQIGLYRQGLLHDLSKYSPTEFLVGARYYQGTRSPNNAEREEQGYSSAWLHHKGRNKHHYEYWSDYSLTKHGMVPVPMPTEYVLEMFIDRIAASKVYRGKQYRDSDPLAYYLGAKDHNLIHEKTRKQLEFLLRMLARDGEEKTFRYIRTKILRGHIVW